MFSMSFLRVTPHTPAYSLQAPLLHAFATSQVSKVFDQGFAQAESSSFESPFPGAVSIHSSIMYIMASNALRHKFLSPGRSKTSFLYQFDTKYLDLFLPT